MSAFKLFLIFGVVAILFMPTLIRRSSALPGIFEQVRARIAGEELSHDKAAEASPAVTQQNTKPTMAERFGSMLARVNNRLRSGKR